jgi:SAM-dependent methyltransferase
MDHDTFSAIAHRDHIYLEPVGEPTMEAMYTLLRLAPGARVVDLGCGKAEAVIRLVELYGAQGTGIDRNASFLEAARQRGGTAMSDGLLELFEGDISDFHAADGSFEVALCMGASQLYGGLRGALAELHRLVVPGGTAVIGEGFWRKPVPDREYLEFLGAAPGDLESHEGNQRLVTEAGWDVLRVWTSSDDEWDAYEELYRNGVEQYAREHPDDPDTPALLDRIRAWYRSYQLYGRFNLGFGVYLLKRGHSTSRNPAEFKGGLRVT